MSTNPTNENTESYRAAGARLGACEADTVVADAERAPAVLRKRVRKARHHDVGLRIAAR